MDGKGRWVDNLFIKRLWRSLKYEDVYLRAYETYGEAQRGIERYFRFYNTERRHQALNRHTPDALYFGRQNLPNAACEGAKIPLKLVSKFRGPFLVWVECRSKGSTLFIVLLQALAVYTSVTRGAYHPSKPGATFQARPH